MTRSFISSISASHAQARRRSRSGPKRGKRDTDADWAKKEQEWSQARTDAYQSWDEIKQRRETRSKLCCSSMKPKLCTSSTARRSMPPSFPTASPSGSGSSGKGLKDFVLNYPYIFEVVEPEDIALPQQAGGAGRRGGSPVAPVAPDADAPAVCVIDSGIQEAHILIQPAIDQATSHCFLPGKNDDDVGDFVEPGGHGTRVSRRGALRRSRRQNGTPKLPFWIQNARVLDEHNKMPEEMFPPEVMRALLSDFTTDRVKRAFSITRSMRTGTAAPDTCRLGRLKSILLSATYDVLIVQSAGNLPDNRHQSPTGR